MYAILICLSLLLLPAEVIALASRPSSRARGQLEQQGKTAMVGDADATSIQHSYPRRHIVFPGGGIFFYWQAGYIDFLRQQHYDLSTSISMTGASAGALSATLTASNVCFERATELALDMAKQAGVWDRKGGLQGVWSAMIRDWLDELLPEDVVERLHERQVSLLVTPIPSFGKRTVSAFKDKQDVIDCNMASVHIPWFLDGHLVTRYREQLVIDGSFLARRKNYAYSCSPDIDLDTLVLDYTLDPIYQRKNLFDAVNALSPDGIFDLLEQGRRFAKQQEEQGMFQQYPRLLDV